MFDDYSQIRSILEQNAEEKFRDFSMKICTSKHPMLGVRVPQIRKYAKQVPTEMIEEFIAINPTTYEEVLLRGFLIARLPYEKMLEWFESHLKYIDDWSTCDLFCSAISKLVQKNKADFLKIITIILNDEHEFTIRVGLVILKCSYIEPDYLDLIFTTADKLSNHEAYYVKMGLAWLISECFIKFPSATAEYLSRSKMPAWTLNKTISKVCDSYRVDAETKKLLKRMRK